MALINLLCISLSPNPRTVLIKTIMIIIIAEVEFVHAVTAGGSVKVLPAVYISPETMRFTIEMKVQDTFYADFISKTVDILLISPFITKKDQND